MRNDSLLLFQYFIAMQLMFGFFHSEWLCLKLRNYGHLLFLLVFIENETIRLETKSFRILPLTYATKYDLT